MPFNGFGIKYFVENVNLDIGQNLYNAVHAFKELLNQTSHSLLEEKNKASVIAMFEFPDEIKSSCEQYLMYFAQFLSDVGINVNTTIEEDSQKVLFSVTPVNKDQALDTIRQALEIYLSLPKQNNLELHSNEFNDLGVRQLVANINHLKSQLILAQSVIQLKDATIQSMERSNYQIIQADQSTTSKKEEEIFGGILTIKEYEANGFKIDLPEIFRRIKRKFSK